MRFQDKVAIVTGGNSGIGRAISLRLAAEGATVLLVARDEAKGTAVCQTIINQGGHAAFFAVELSAAEQVAALVAQVGEKYGRLDILINNAGGGESRPRQAANHPQTAADQAITRWHHMEGSNFRSAYLMTTLALDLMKPHGAAIVNTSSTASWHGDYGLYGAMKAGLEGLTRSFAVDLAPFNIRVNAVAPGWIQTPNTLANPDDPRQQTWAKTASLLGRMGQPEEVAAATLFLASADASFITGATLIVDGGLSVIDPTAATWRESRRQ